MFLARCFIVAVSALCLLVLFNSAAFAQSRGLGGVVRLNDGGTVKLYDDYQALVIGVGDYEHWPRLPGAVRDAREVSRVLRDMGFKVKLELNPSSARLKKLLDELPYKLGSKQDRGLLIYFAGHGETEVLANKKKLGYIVPTDSPLITTDPMGFARTAISMSIIEDLAFKIKSRHVLMAFDSCFSGSIFALGRAAPTYITNKVARPVRQFVTAGNENETVPDRSMFKRVFVDGIQGEADHDKDGYITGSELGMYLQKHVVTYTNNAQHPQFGRIRDPDLDKGDFVFMLAGGTDTGPDLRQQRIDKLLTEADALFQRNDLTTPQGANALERYNQVLRLDPLNSRAYSGKKKIVGKYVEWARIRYEAGNYSKAERYLASAEKVIENDQRVWKLAEKVRQAKGNAAQKEKERLEERARQKAAFEAEQERKAKAEAERKLKETAKGKTFTNSLGMKFVRIPAGSFMMGSNLSPEETVNRYGGKADWYKREHPQHRVSLSKPFYIQTTEVTVGQFRRFAESISYKTDAEKGKGVWTYTGSKWERKAGSSWRDVGFAQGDKHPVVGISWNDAQAFVSWLNKQEGTSKYRLPTESEWEYAARAGSTTAYCYGDDEGRLGDYAWYAKNSGSQTHLVGQKKPNSWGLYDMHGNVWEWVQDWYGSYSSGSITDPVGPSSGSPRVDRGGGWNSPARSCRSANRSRNDPGYAFSYPGLPPGPRTLTFALSPSYPVPKSAAGPPVQASSLPGFYRRP